MKNGKHLIGYLIVILLTFYATKKYYDNQTKPNEPSNSVANDHLPEHMEPPTEIISREDAFELYDSYTVNRACPIDLIERTESYGIREKCSIDRPINPLFEAARSAYMSKEYIQQYLAYIQQETQSRGQKITGYRFYFANYPNKEQFNDGRPIKSPGKNTFFISPTVYDTIRKMHVGITLTNDKKGNITPLILEDYFEQETRRTTHQKERNAAGLFATPSVRPAPSYIGNDVGSHP